MFLVKVVCFLHALRGFNWCRLGPLGVAVLQKGSGFPLCRFTQVSRVVENGAEGKFL